jgi:hypothetical protein
MLEFDPSASKPSKKSSKNTGKKEKRHWVGVLEI